jgi:hypothetical protein
LNLQPPALRAAAAAKTVATPMTPALAAKPSRRPLAVAAVLVLTLAAGVGAWLLWHRSPPAPAASEPVAARPAAPLVTTPAAESSSSSQGSKAAEPAPSASAKAPQEDTKAATAGKDAPSRGGAAPELTARVKPAGVGGGSATPLVASNQGGRSLFSQADIPALLARADGYAGNGQYDRAISLYQVVLKIDPRNQSAREGLQRARGARGLRP